MTTDRPAGKRALEQALGIVERLDQAKSTSTASRAFFDALAPFGARGFGVRAYVAAGGSDSGAPGFVYAQVLPPRWRDSASARYVEKLDPLPKAARRLARPAFLWSEASPRNDPKWADYWSALGELNLGEGTAVHFFAPNGMTSRVSVGFDRSALDISERRAIELASYALITRLQALSPMLPARTSVLSPRERDCLAFVAQGFSDSEIAERLSITQSTTHFYIEKAKRKLGARTRAQAVAHLIAAGLF
jgi:LuxR family quorum sensing-dependent transcriptional regulator